MQIPVLIDSHTGFVPVAEARRLGARRREARITQEFLSVLLGIRRETLSRMENGRQDMNARIGALYLVYLPREESPEVSG